MTGLQILQFFDKFGLAVFTFILIDALLTPKRKKDWRVWVRVGIGIIGLLVDGYNVFFVK